jgi:hypothetical protein
VLTDGTLVAGGDFMAADGAEARFVAQWDGEAWTALGGGLDSTVYALTALPDGAVVAGGEFTVAGGGDARHVALWDGQWHSLGTGISGGAFPTVHALVANNNGDLFAAGDFTEADGDPASLIARWDGNAWFPLGSGVGGHPFSTAQALTVLPNGDIAVGGFITIAGGDVSAYWARWGCASECPGDIDGSGSTDGADLGLLLANWGNAGAGDLDGSGAVDGGDLGLLLAAWGGCP